MLSYTTPETASILPSAIVVHEVVKQGSITNTLGSIIVVGLIGWCAIAGMMCATSPFREKGCAGEKPLFRLLALGAGLGLLYAAFWLYQVFFR